MVFALSHRGASRRVKSGASRRVKSGARLSLCALALLGCDASGQVGAEGPRPADATAPELHDAAVAVGSAASSSSGFHLDVLEVRACPAPAHDPLSSDERLLGVKLSLRAEDEHSVPVNFFYAELEDTEQRRFRASLHGCSPELAAPPLRAGQTAEGWVNFRLPRESVEAKLSYAPRVGAEGTPLVVTRQLATRQLAH